MKAVFGNDDRDNLISQFYASAMGETPWTATLGLAAGLFRSSASLLQVNDAAGNVLAIENYGYSREFSDAFFASEAYVNDPRIPYFRRVPPGTIYFDHMLYDVGEMERNRWCRESFDILKTKYQLGAILRLPHDLTVGFAILSSPEEGHATQSAIESFCHLVPHIEKACALGHILARNMETRAALLDGLARKADGVILLDRAAAPVFMNEAAADILSAGDGLAFTNEVWTSRRLPETRKLQCLIQGAITASRSKNEQCGGYMTVSRLSGRRPYALHILPAPKTEQFLAGQGIACVIHLQDLAAVPVPSRDSLREVFGLTERETDFTIEFMRCQSLRHAAANAGVALNTARNHLQSVFRKTGSDNQAELAQLLSRLA